MRFILSSIVCAYCFFYILYDYTLGNTTEIYIVESESTHAIHEENPSTVTKDDSSQSLETPKTVIHTDEVVVSATKVDKNLLDVPASISIITKEDIARKNAKTIGDALSDVPGVELTNDGTQGLKRISIRGEKTSGTLILIDGQRIVENKSVEGTPVLIDPSRIERIEVIKGPASVLYGADAVGGVINIITKKGGKEPIQGEAFVGYNTNTNGFTEGLSLFGGHKGVSYRASIAQNDQGNLRTPKGKVNNTQYSNTDANFYIDYSFLDKYTVGIGYDYYHANIHGTIEPRALNGQYYNRFEANMPSWERHKFSTFFLGKNITSYLSQIRVDIFLQENKKEFNNIVQTAGAALNPTITTESTNKNQQLGLSFQTDWLLAEHTLLIVGYELGYDILDTKGTASMTIVPPLSMKESYKAKGHSITNALYAQGETGLPHDFVLNYGTRLSIITAGIDSFSGRLLVRPPAPPGASDVVVSTEEKTYVHPVFSFGTMYTGFEDTTLRFSFSQGFRAPSLQERFLNTAGAETILANPKIKPETSHTAEIGARYFANALSMDITVFYTFTENYIIAQPTATNNVFQYNNVGKAHTVGIEGDIRYRIASLDLTPYTTITFIKRQFDYGKFATWSTGTPDVSGRFGVLYEKDFEIENISFYLDVFGKYATSATYTQPKGTTGKETLHIDSYITANISTGIRFGHKRQFSFDVIANNLFNTLYISPVAVRQVGAGYLYEAGFSVAMQMGARF